MLTCTVPSLCNLVTARASDSGLYVDHCALYKCIYTHIHTPFQQPFSGKSVLDGCLIDFLALLVQKQPLVFYLPEIHNSVKAPKETVLQHTNGNFQCWRYNNNILTNVIWPDTVVLPVNICITNRETSFTKHYTKNNTPIMNDLFSFHATVEK